MNHFQIHFMLHNNHKYVWLHIHQISFLFYTQSSDDMGLIFHAKLTLCFISNIYAGFILLKIECAMECPPS